MINFNSEALVEHVRLRVEPERPLGRLAPLCLLEDALALARQGHVENFNAHKQLFQLERQQEVKGLSAVFVVVHVQLVLHLLQNRLHRLARAETLLPASKRFHLVVRVHHLQVVLGHH